MASCFLLVATFQRYEAAFAGTDITIAEDADDILGSIWLDRPEKPNNIIYEHALDYAGVSWQQKVDDVRTAMIEEDPSMDAHIVTGLDDTACT